LHADIVAAIPQVEITEWNIRDTRNPQSVQSKGKVTAKVFLNARYGEASEVQKATFNIEVELDTRKITGKLFVWQDRVSFKLQTRISVEAQLKAPQAAGNTFQKEIQSLIAIPLDWLENYHERVEELAMELWKTICRIVETLITPDLVRLAYGIK